MAETPDDLFKRLERDMAGNNLVNKQDLHRFVDNLQPGEKLMLISYRPIPDVFMFKTFGEPEFKDLLYMQWVLRNRVLDA